MHGPTTDPYLVLGVPPTASERQIHRAYRGLAKQFHPDRWQEADPETQAQTTAKMREINAAYAELAHRTAPMRSGAGAGAGPAARQRPAPTPPPTPTYSAPRGPEIPPPHAAPPPPTPTWNGPAPDADDWFHIPVRPWTAERAGPPPRARCRTCGLAYNKRLWSCPFCFDPNRAEQRWSYERTDRIGLYAVITIGILLFLLVFVFRWWNL